MMTVIPGRKSLVEIGISQPSFTEIDFSTEKFYHNHAADFSP
jgi:hypothetical protein